LNRFAVDGFAAMMVPCFGAMTTEPQTSNSVLLVRPASFGFHPEAASSNAFASASDDPDLAKHVLREFDGLAARLTYAGIDVLVLEDRPKPAKPDAIYPNNWVSFHADGTMVLYPMATKARRLERDAEGLIAALSNAGFAVRRTVDLSFHERSGHFLEGTGSLVLDRPERRAFANLSPRTDAQVIADFDDRLDYTTLVFDAHDRSGKPIYHTNVLLSLGTSFAVLCAETVPEESLGVLTDELEASGRTVVQVDYDQLKRFACNIIELRSASGDPLIAMSSAALDSFTPAQVRTLERFGSLLDAPIATIEAVGGGSVRCMIGDFHLPRSA
jgi:hypothetical protein